MNLQLVVLSSGLASLMLIEFVEWSHSSPPLHDFRAKASGLLLDVMLSQCLTCIARVEPIWEVVLSNRFCSSFTECSFGQQPRPSLHAAVGTFIDLLILKNPE